MLLLDQNISRKIVREIEQVFPGCVHVFELGLSRASDSEVWNYAHEHNLAIVPKDADFHQRSFVHGFPPKVIGLLLGNCSSIAMAKSLLDNEILIKDFLDDETAAFLALQYLS